MQHRAVIITLNVKLKSNFHNQIGKNNCPYNLKEMRENPDKSKIEIENINTKNISIANLWKHISDRITEILIKNYPADKK